MRDGKMVGLLELWWDGMGWDELEWKGSIGKGRRAGSHGNALENLMRAYRKEADNADTWLGNTDAEILVPLTTSLYVPGKLADREKVIVDIGTGFYVEKVHMSLVLFWKLDVWSKRMVLMPTRLIDHQRCHQVLQWQGR
jgi:Prefoldin subunit